MNLPSYAVLDLMLPPGEDMACRFADAFVASMSSMLDHHLWVTGECMSGLDSNRDALTTHYSQNRLTCVNNRIRVVLSSGQRIAGRAVT